MYINEFYGSFFFDCLVYSLEIFLYQLLGEFETKNYFVVIVNCSQSSDDSSLKDYSEKQFIKR